MGDSVRREIRWLYQHLILGLSVMLSPFVYGQEQDQSVVNIAIAGPMSGTSASIGTQFQAGVLAALTLETDGTLLGRDIMVSDYDDQCRANIAHSVAEDVANQQPELVIGHSCSSATLAAVPVYAAHNLLQITPASTAPEITQQGIPTVFRMLGRDDQQGQLAAEYIIEHYPDARIGMLRFPSRYSTGAIEVAIKILEESDAKVVQVIDALASATSYLEQVLQMMEAEIDVVYAVGGVLDIGVFTRQASMLRANFRIISADSLISASFPGIAGPEANDVIFTFPADVRNNITPEQFSKIEQAIKQHSDVEARGYALLSYAAIEVWIEGVQRAQSFASHRVAEAIREAPINTILGDISFDENGDILTRYPPFSWHEWRDGESHVME